MNKPPLGLVPSYIWKLKRIEEIKSAMHRYLEANAEIPIAWIDEHDKLREEIIDESRANARSTRPEPATTTA